MTTDYGVSVEFNNPLIKTLGEWFKYPLSPVYPSEKNLGMRWDDTEGKWVKDEKFNWEEFWVSYISGFLYYKDRDGEKNITKLFNSLGVPLELTEIHPYFKMNVLQYPIVCGTRFFIPSSKVQRQNKLLNNFPVVSYNEQTFKAAQLAVIENDLGYERVISPLDGNQGDVLKDIYPEVTVWVWCRGLTPEGQEEMTGKVFDVTPFIISVETNVGVNGGNFSINLGPILCEKNEKGDWSIKPSSYKVANNKASYLADSSTSYYDENGQIVRERFLLHEILTPNDVVFIRFETLKFEKLEHLYNPESLVKDPREIFNKTNIMYDMIGLIDTNRQSVDSTKNEVSINVNGRDLSKLLIEDGVYFYPLENKQGKPKFVGESSLKSGLGRRMINTSGLTFFTYAYDYKGIQEIVQFVLSQLTNIEIVPDSVFTDGKLGGFTVPYGKEGSKHYELLTEANNRHGVYVRDEEELNEDTILKNIKLKEEEISSKREEVVHLIKTLRSRQSLTNSSQSQENDIGEFLLNSLIQFVVTLDSGQTPLSSYNSKGELTGWSSGRYLTEDFSQSLLPNSLEVSLIKREDKQRSKKTVELVGKVAYLRRLEREFQELLQSNKVTELSSKPRGIWRLFKFVIDEQVLGRRVVDRSMSTAQGSLLNFIKKCCQREFVDYQLDTYSNLFYLVIRKPPFDRVGVNSLLSGSVKTEDGNYKINSNRSVIDINPEDVFQEALSFDDREAYSWYHFSPSNQLLGTTRNYSTNYIPAIIFDEYAKVWGAKSLDIQHNYMPYVNLNSEKNDNIISDMEKQAFEDMAFLVETHQYLPFTRKGTLVVNRDRRIKRGNFIRYKLTGEIFYVEGVKHTHQVSKDSVDSSTVIEVSRGMVERFVTGQDVDFNGVTKKVSYFDIINTKLNLDATQVVQKKVRKTIVVDEPVPQPTDIQSSTVNQSNSVLSPDYRISDAGLEFIKKLEGFKNKSYNDGYNGEYSVGYGTQTYTDGTKVGKGEVVTKEQAHEMLIYDLYTRRQPWIKRFFPGILFLQNEIDALYAHILNVGSIYYSSQKILVNLIKQYKASPSLFKNQVLEQWRKTVTAGYDATTGKRNLTLLEGRRLKEVNYFLNSSYEISVSRVVDIPNRVEKEVEEIIPNEFTTIIDRSQVFSNFKVDKDIFNFFLKKNQFDKKYRK